MSETQSRTKDEPVEMPSPRETETLPPRIAPAEGLTPTIDAGPELVDGTGAPPAVPGYEILAELGRGGMGVVYKARQIMLNRPVALKMILAGEFADAAARQRFLAEAEAIARLQHPHIVQVHEFSTFGQKPYFALEYVAGGSLAQKLAGTPQQPRYAAELVEKLARGIQAAHEKGIVHRDLKPANVLLTETGEPKITDFGLAKQFDATNPDRKEGEGLTATGAVLGTPSYMAPEQAGGNKTIGPAADVYALGAILYECLTGRPPFKAATPLDTVLQVVSEEPVPPSQLIAKTPRDLETICLKCLQKEPAKRYQAATGLADDLRRYLNGEPITARPIAAWERAVKWIKRHPTKAALVAVVAGGLVVAVGSLEYTRRATRAAALVQSLAAADTAAVPTIIGELPGYRLWADPLLADIHTHAASDKERLHASLALLPSDPSQVEYLRQRVVTSTPAEIIVIRQSLADHAAEVSPQLWTVAQDQSAALDQRFRALAALAALDPQSERWQPLAGPVTQRLVEENPLLVGQWLEAFRPVRLHLLTPLAALCRKPLTQVNEPDLERSLAEFQQRSLAVSILADYANDQSALLADLLMDADPRQFAVLWPPFAKVSHQALPVLMAELDRKLADLETQDAKERLAKRQANAAVALLKLNQPEHVWPLLKHSRDPRARSYTIHRFGPLGADAGVIVKRLAEEPDMTIRRALILSLGEFGEEAWTPAEKKLLVQRLQEMYQTADDPGLHAATEWLLRQWKQEQWLKQVDEQWAKDKEGREKRLERIKESLKQERERAKPQWYVNGQGQTMVVIPGPVEFMMGSPPTEADRRSEELLQKKRISRTFALSTKAVTKEQFLKYFPKFSHMLMKRYPEPTCPIGGVTWYEAAAYCNWLSKQEGIPEDQWGYETNPQGQVTKLKENYLSRTGYRLPTQAEVEVATRAEAVTSRYYGETEDLLPKYAWYFKNSRELAWPVGSKKPNDWGLFDLHGNVWCWCQESDTLYSKANEAEAFDDQEHELVIVSTDTRVLRGGSFGGPASYVRSVSRNYNVPTARVSDAGFRPARTFR